MFALVDLFPVFLARRVERRLQHYRSDLETYLTKARRTRACVHTPRLQQVLQSRHGTIPRAWHANDALLRDLLRPFPFTIALGPNPVPAEAAESDSWTAVAGYDNLYQIITHVARDWTVEGATVRAQAHRHLLSRLQLWAPATATED